VKIIQEIFNNREISLLIWLLLIFLAILSIKIIRNGLWNVFKMLFQKQFLKVYFFLIVYLSVIFLFLYSIRLWNSTDIKNSVFWFFTVAMVIVFSINSTKKISDFKKLFFDTIKITIILEFIINLFSFSLLTELIMLPFLTFIVMLQVFSEADNKNFQVTKLLNNILSFIGLSILLFSIYKTYKGSNTVTNIGTLKSFILPIILTILFIPFAYLLSLYSIYQSYFIRLDFMTVKKDKVKTVKKIIRKTANINLKKLNNIIDNFDKKVFYDDTDLKKHLKEISKITKPVANKV
jgi:hypothetical protein